MKNKLAFAVSLASATMLSASVIEWDLPNLTSGETPLDPANVTFVIASSVGADGIVQSPTVADGANVTIDYQEPGGTYVEGTYTDNITSGEQSYVMAFYDSSSGNYYAVSDGSTGYVTVTVDNDADPRTGNNIGSYSATELGRSSVSTMSSNVSPSPAVPEPATAALALAGIALLMRRRRVS